MARDPLPPGAYRVTREQLRAFTLFDGVPDALSRDLLKTMERQPVPRGEVVYARGDTSREVYFVVRGEFVGFMLSDTGREVAVAQMRPGNIFGDTDALSGGGRDFTVQAMTNAEVLRVGHATFNQWVSEHPSISRNLLGILSARAAPERHPVQFRGAPCRHAGAAETGRDLPRPERLVSRWRSGSGAKPLGDRRRGRREPRGGEPGAVDPGQGGSAGNRPPQAACGRSGRCRARPLTAATPRTRRIRRVCAACRAR